MSMIEQFARKRQFHISWDTFGKELYAKWLFEDESDESKLKKLLQQKFIKDTKRLSWKKLGTFVSPNVNFAGHEDTVYKRGN